MTAIPQQHLDNIAKYASDFAKAKPFKRIVIDDFLPRDLAENILTYFPSLTDMEKRYFFVNEQKKEQSDFSKLNPCFQTVKEFLNSDEFVSFVSKLTEIQNLLVDEHQLGSGCHQGGNGSFLDIHIDFNRHPITGLHRRLNLIIFFNKDWQESMGGMLELWNEDVTLCLEKIQPDFNRCVIFETNEISYHGYNRVMCDSSTTRKSLAMYYYTEDRSIEEIAKNHTTLYKNRPSESLIKRWMTSFRNTLYHLVSR